MPLVNKTFSDIITFTRASSATMFDSSGTLVYAPMNLLLQSEDLSTTWSLADGTVTANSWTAPTGEVTGDTYTVGTSATVPSQSVTVADSTTYTLSFYYDKTLTTAAFFRLRFGTASGSVSAWVDAANNTFGALNAQLSGGVVTDVGNNIYRVSLQIAYGASDGGSRTVAIAGVTANSGTTADTGNDLAIWGFQFNISNMQGGVTADLSTYYPTTSAAYQGPRLDYDPATLEAQGLLIEEQRTNSIRNNTMQGAVAGTPGTLPTNWTGTSSANGLTREVVGTGTESGITYIDVRYSGTTTSAAFHALNEEPVGAVAATSGQTWTHTVYISIVGGSAANINDSLVGINEYSSVPAVVAGSSTQFTLSSGALTGKRFTTVRTLTGASTASIQPFFVLSYDSGVAIDITLRIGLPQLEQGAFATSVIPTTTTALTRSADEASVNTLSPWFNATEGAFFVQASTADTSTNTKRIISINDGSNSNRLDIYYGPTITAVTFVNAGGSSQPSLTNTGLTQTNQNKIASAYKLNDYAMATNSGAVDTETSILVPSGISQMRIGYSVAAGVLNGHIQRITYYPRRLSDAELQSLTS